MLHRRRRLSILMLHSRAVWFDQEKFLLLRVGHSRSELPTCFLLLEINQLQGVCRLVLSDPTLALPKKNRFPQ